MPTSLPIRKKSPPPTDGKEFAVLYASIAAVLLSFIMHHPDAATWVRNGMQAEFATSNPLGDDHEIVLAHVPSRDDCKIRANNGTEVVFVEQSSDNRTEDLNSGGSIRDIQMLAGHTNLRTTQCYIDQNPDASLISGCRRSTSCTGTIAVRQHA